VKFEISLS